MEKHDIHRRRWQEMAMVQSPSWEELGIGRVAQDHCALWQMALLDVRADAGSSRYCLRHHAMDLDIKWRFSCGHVDRPGHL